MAKAITPRLADVLGVMNALCPPDLAEDWDNIGLQVGDPGAKIETLLVSLDAEEPALEEACRCHAQLIVAHHPLIFSPLKRITPTDLPGRIIFQAIKNDIAVVSAHTNLDRAADGLNDWLAARLGVVDAIPLETVTGTPFYKLIVYVPAGYEDDVRDAVFAAGGGHIGSYDRCSFSSRGDGTFRGGDDTAPFIGTAGTFETTAEVRLEIVLPKTIADRVIARMLKAHPYEEVAYDLIPLANTAADVGLGRIGSLTEPQPLRHFAAQVKHALQLPGVKLVGDLDRTIKRVAVCGGTGMSLYAAARRRGADCFVTGDIKYHEAQRARADGVALIDAGHFATEQIMVAELAQRLRKALAERQYNTEIIEMAAEKDPLILF